MQEKNYFFQSIRGLIIIFVVLIHSLMFNEQNNTYNYINIVIRTIINFCVATFIFFAAYFTNLEQLRNNYKEFYYKKIKRVVIPFFIWSAIYTIIYFVQNIDIINYIKLICRFILGLNGGQLYFIIALIQLILITPLLIKVIDKRNKTINRCILATTPIYTLLNFFYNLKMGNSFPFYATIFLAWISFYYFGLMVKGKYIEIKRDKMKTNIVITTIILIINIIINISEYKLGLNYSYCTSQIKLTNSIYSLIVIFMLYSINKMYNNKFKSKLLCALGDYSFGIYLIHLIYIAILKKITIELQVNYVFEFIFITVVTLLMSTFTIKIIKKVTNNRYNKYLGF